ncbi:hypothetical protein BU16DRAFT_449914 [Lophium mytilinum]|uniref:Uncharacterized protein n=1 Tax=Lophium mytilinum TaxID=390894 RepID=A0A6A6R901_9PEZI|nr:hypothetical protein BU16DRAFT_449914 [Lophium mytilinum]
MDSLDDSSGYDSEYDELSRFKWLEQMDGKVLWTSPDGLETTTIGQCSGELISRPAIRHIFHEEMDGPSTEISSLGFGLFDRYGRLKPEFKTHSVKKGSGVWQDELDSGDILLINVLHVKLSHRRRGLGRKMFVELFEKARKKTVGSFFAIVQPGYLTRESDEEMGDVSGEERKAFYHQAEDAACHFWRQLGFRRIGSSIWFGFASKPDHACHSLLASDDYDPPSPAYTPDPINEAIRSTISKTGDDECVEHLRLREVASGDPRWRAIDDKGNTFLHIAVTACKPKTLKWILQQNSDSDLLDFRNGDGLTPLEVLLELLEVKRTRGSFFRGKPWSDEFDGFSPAAVECLSLLKGITQDIEKLRLMYGCTCGICIGGFLSPRMSFALLCQAEINHDMLRSSINDFTSTGLEFVQYNQDDLQFLQPSVRASLARNQPMREGFINFFDHFATCIRSKMLPTEPFVMRAMQNSNEQPPVSQNFLERGGTIYSIGSVIFKKAMEQDMWAGDGEHWSDFEDDIRKLPYCRNDHEFAFVSGMCGFKRVSRMRYV